MDEAVSLEKLLQYTYLWNNVRRGYYREHLFPNALAKRDTLQGLPLFRLTIRAVASERPVFIFKLDMEQLGSSESLARPSANTVPFLDRRSLSL
jgi:hypothetical protein